MTSIIDQLKEVRSFLNELGKYQPVSGRDHANAHRFAATLDADGR